MKPFFITFIKKFLILVTSFLLPIKSILLLVGLMIMSDTIIGIIKAKKKGEQITSNKLSNVVFKMLTYQLVVITFYMLEVFILQDILVLFIGVNLILTKLIALTLITIELKSIDESYKLIYGISLYDKFKKALKGLNNIKKDIKSIKD